MINFKCQPALTKLETSCYRYAVKDNMNLLEYNILQEFRQITVICVHRVLFKNKRGEDVRTCMIVLTLYFYSAVF